MVLNQPATRCCLTHKLFGQHDSKLHWQNLNCTRCWAENRESLLFVRQPASNAFIAYLTCALRRTRGSKAMRWHK
jgi:hypothetical protein